jgi:hypothetical protein
MELSGTYEAETAMTEDEFAGRVADGLIGGEAALYRAVSGIEPPVQDIWPDPGWNRERGMRAFDVILAGGTILHLLSSRGRAFTLLTDDDLNAEYGGE